MPPGAARAAGLASCSLEPGAASASALKSNQMFDVQRPATVSRRGIPAVNFAFLNPPDSTLMPVERFLCASILRHPPARAGDQRNLSPPKLPVCVSLLPLCITGAALDSDHRCRPAMANETDAMADSRLVTTIHRLYVMVTAVESGWITRAAGRYVKCCSLRVHEQRNGH